MPKLHRWIMFYSLLTITSASYGNEYKGYIKLNPDECIPMGKEVVISKLPLEWRKYSNFVKICKLQHGMQSPSKISIISVWVKDYFQTLPASSRDILENFPLPLIFDNEFKNLGKLPEPYPGFDVADPDIYYGEWQLGLPTKILIDIYNPAVDGDYYYAPIKWNKEKNRYELNDLEEKYGRRPE